ncbi:hypothetical protein Tco_1031316 [Tanacetum coccineum]|uniref:Uncharacterized protein n=1 Tax=Tanacetum coccineum TaxID=301880 RepID=A0ABQ5GA54_9ASTR
MNHRTHNNNYGLVVGSLREFTPGLDLHRMALRKSIYQRWYCRQMIPGSILEPRDLFFSDPHLSPDYSACALERPEQAPPSPIYIPFVPEPVYPEFLPVDDEDPEEVDEEDPEGGSSRLSSDRKETQGYEEPSAVALFRLTKDPHTCAYPLSRQMSIRPQAPAPFLSEEVAERLLALPTPPPSPLSPYSSPLPQIPSPPLPIPSPPPNSPNMLRDLWDPELLGLNKEMHKKKILPSPVHELRCLKIC